MAAEPHARHLHSRSQSEKVERKEMKLSHLRKQKYKVTSLRRKNESPTNNGNKFPNTYQEDKRKIRGSPQMAKKEFEKGNEVLLLSPNRGPHGSWKIYTPYVVTQRIDRRTYRIVNHEGRMKTPGVSCKQIEKICPSRRPASQA